VASDLDGIIAIGTIDRKACVPFKLANYYATCQYSGFLKDVPNLIIITGRKEHFRKITEGWLNSHNVAYSKLIMFPNGEWKTREKQTLFKAIEIVANGVDVYYEDDEKIAEELKKKCPKTIIKTVQPKSLNT
jgi:uncharacterized HAD superfamily protein